MDGRVDLCWLALGAALVVGCAHPRQTKFMESIPGVTISTDELRARTLELGRRETALVEEAVANAYNSTEEPKVRRAIVSWALKAIPAVQEATIESDPLVALGDQWALALQTEIFAREGAGRARLGDAHVFVGRAAREMVRESEQVALVVFGAAGLAQPRARVEEWAKANPIAAATFARPSAKVAFPRALVGARRSAIGFIASTDDRLTLMSARMEMMNETILDRARWTSELVAVDALGTQNVRNFLDLAKAVVADEHAKLMNDVAEQRDQLFVQLDQQRRAAFGDIARERAHIFEQVAGERAAITGQADALLQQMNANTRALIDRTLLRVGVGAAALIVLAALAAWIVWRTSRRRRGPEPRARHRSRGLRPAIETTG